MKSMMESIDEGENGFSLNYEIGVRVARALCVYEIGFTSIDVNELFFLNLERLM